MKRLSIITRVTIGLTSVTLALLCAAYLLKLVPDPLVTVIQGRGQLCEAMAIQLAAGLHLGDARAVSDTAESIVSRNSDLLSIAVRGVDGGFLVKTRNHEKLWKNKEGARSTATHVQVPLYKQEEQWATVEFCFRPVVPDTPLWFLYSRTVQLTAFLTLGGFFAYRLYLRKILVHLDPSTVIPERVKAVLDTLAEGVLALDENERIVIANDGFCKCAGHLPSELLGRKVSELPWVGMDGQENPDYPWTQTARDGMAQRGRTLKLKNGPDSERSFMINTVPILGADGRKRGVMATFDDVTELEQKTFQLEDMVRTLNDSREKIRRQNTELEQLATRDPLTTCLNRRAFMARFESEWNEATRYGHPLSCLLLDIDHFKAVNDNHGHQVGDNVLQSVAGTIKRSVRNSDIVCRYGGEEFCILLPHTPIENAQLAAEKLRREIDASPIGGICVTVSLGVSTLGPGAQRIADLVEQADQALYAAKKSGRNQTVRWDQMPEVFESDVSCLSRISTRSAADHGHIPLQAVNALLNVIRYRDPEIASHARRVADLCTAVAGDLMPAGDLFVLEIAASLHDFGKIGVPDAVLLKPGPLTEDEWKVMTAHERIGIEIINSAFEYPELTNIIRCHHAHFGGNPREPGLPVGVDIPLRARILSIADAYDTMTHERPYRKKMTDAEAVAELRRCSGTQFDPRLVERFIEHCVSCPGGSEYHALSDSIETSLRLGLEVERLAVALEANDFATLEAMTDRLVALATKMKLPKIAELAAGLKQSVASEYNMQMVMETSQALIDACRLLQGDWVATRQNDLTREAEAVK